MRHRAGDMNMPLGAAFKKRKKPNRPAKASGCPTLLTWQVCYARLAGSPARAGGEGVRTPALSLGARDDAQQHFRRIQNEYKRGAPSGTRTIQLALLEYLQEAGSATQLAPLPTTLIPCFPGYATANHHHPNFNLRFYKSLLRAF